MTKNLNAAHVRRYGQTDAVKRLARVIGAAGAGLLALGVITSCGPGPSTARATTRATPASTSLTSPSSSPSSTASTAMIHISSFRYAVPTSVAPGSMVSVMNMDGENHTVTADSGNVFDVKATAGTTVTFTAPSKPGRYPFHCTYHSNMHGILVVK